MNARDPIKSWEPAFWPCIALGAFLCLWYAGVQWSGTRVFPSPLDVERGFEELLRKGLLWSYMRDSLLRVGAGYALAVLSGIPLGLFLGWYPRAAATVNPVIQMLRPISPLAWIPLSIVWFGTSDWAAVFLIFLASFFPIVVSTTNSVRGVPVMFRQAGNNFGLAPVALIYRVVFPEIGRAHV